MSQRVRQASACRPALRLTASKNVDRCASNSGRPSTRWRTLRCECFVCRRVCLCFACRGRARAYMGSAQKGGNAPPAAAVAARARRLRPRPALSVLDAGSLFRCAHTRHRASAVCWVAVRGGPGADGWLFCWRVELEHELAALARLLLQQYQREGCCPCFVLFELYGTQLERKQLSTAPSPPPPQTRARCRCSRVEQSL